MKGDQKQYADLIKTENSTLSLENIESSIRHKNIRKHFEKEYGEKLYSEILLVLTHERYEPEKAKLIWNKITLHLDNLTKILDRNPGIVVATLDYLSNFQNSLLSPVLVQEDKSDFISETTTRDGLTQLYLKNVFNFALEKELEKSFRSKKNLSLLMIDIDDFKQVNDNYGHLEGDEALRTIGKLINENIRKMDTAARYGGEELAIIVPESTPSEAVLLAQRIREKISKIKFSSYSVTVSIGVCHSSLDIKTTNDMISRADEALYEAKQSGKNRVVVFKGRK
ncbi:GGDEF domain-containing protein [Candidatus Sulfurimonas baltica]|uniref:diguanylate cyclase n=1 Tax=Candidatus Sulfurimonas baltica TaxID=2740404 RepID=A0A7S7LVW0_9BACT|nr:GGDEF domain-containing protein [Candidatus Sulfurimonas baltica]QOY51813.1 GGDEF domain-containing protein [Candidatus Sulfurimonas baltica]